MRVWVRLYVCMLTRNHICMCVCSRETTYEETRVLLPLPPPFSSLYSSTLFTSLRALPRSQHFSHLLYSICSSPLFSGVHLYICFQCLLSPDLS